MRDVVITGIGVVSPIGTGFDAFWDSLLAQRSGIRHISPFHEAGIPFGIGAPVLDFDGRQFVQPRKSLKVMSSEIQAAYAAAELACRHAGIAKGTIDPDRFGVVLGSEMLYGEIDELVTVYQHCSPGGEFDFSLWGKHAFVDIFPLWMLKYLPNMAACHVGIAHDARGPNNSITLGEVSSLLALMEGASYIQRDIADVVLVGGSGSRLSSTALPFRGAHDVTRWTGEPAAASRPFDHQRDGMVNGEGAGVVVLENRQHAERRGVTILASVAGFASRSEPAMREAMTGSSIRHAIGGALKSAKLDAATFGHVNAHGNSTIHGDRIEARAIHDLLGDVAVTAPKSYFGYLGAGSGMVELAASVGALMHGVLPPTLNYETPDPDCPVNVVRGEPRTSSPQPALVLNFNTTGQAAAVVLAPPDHRS